MVQFCEDHLGKVHQCLDDPVMYFRSQTSSCRAATDDTLSGVDFGVRKKWVYIGYTVFTCEQMQRRVLWFRRIVGTLCFFSTPEQRRALCDVQRSSTIRFEEVDLNSAACFTEAFNWLVAGAMPMHYYQVHEPIEDHLPKELKGMYNMVADGDYHGFGDMYYDFWESDDESYGDPFGDVWASIHEHNEKVMQHLRGKKYTLKVKYRGNCCIYLGSVAIFTIVTRELRTTKSLKKDHNKRMLHQIPSITNALDGSGVVIKTEN